MGGLQSFEEDNDVLTAIARELVSKHGIGESADALWKQRQTERMQILPPIPKPVAVEDTEADHLTPEPCAPPTPAIPNSASELSSVCGPSESCSASTGCAASSPRAVLVVLSPSSRAEDNWCKRKTG
jgi:hypothetical protein